MRRLRRAFALVLACSAGSLLHACFAIPRAELRRLGLGAAVACPLASAAESEDLLTLRSNRGRLEMVVPKSWKPLVDTSETLLSASAFLSQGFDDFATLEAERLKLSELLDRFSGSVQNLQTSSWSEVTQPPLTKEQVALELIQPFLTPNTQTFQSAESMEQAIAGGSLFNASVGSLQSASALMDLDITDEGPASALSFRAACQECCGNSPFSSSSSALTHPFLQVLTKFLNAEAARSMGQSGVVAQNRYWRVKAILCKGVIVAAYLSATEKHVLPEYQGTANKAYLDGIVDSLKLA